MLIVTMTSWKKRINNCLNIVKMIMNNTVKPDMIYLNLSDDEFSSKEQDLPQDLVKESMCNPYFIINWVPGPNTKSMKKVLPILDKLDDDDIIIVIDDDFIYPTDFIEKRLEDFKRYNCECAITGAQSKDSLKDCKSIFFKQFTCGASSTTIYTKKMFNNINHIIDNNVLSSYHDDGLYTIILYLNGYKFERCSTYPVWSDKYYMGNRLEKYNDDKGLSRNKGHWSTIELVEYVKINILEKTYGYVDDWFGYFRDNDLVEKHNTSHNLYSNDTYQPPHPNPHVDIKRDTDGGSKNTPSSTISKLREDIQAGRVVKIPTANGFIWKRVK